MAAHNEQKHTLHDEQAIDEPSGGEQAANEKPQQEAAFSESADSKSHQAAEAGAEDDTAADTAAAELEALRLQAEEQQQRLLRVQADYDNFRRRTRLEKEEYLKYAASDLTGQLLPVLDNFDRALAAAQGGSDYEALLKGVDMIFRQFQGVLEQAGLQAMDAVGEPFNPEFHNAVMTEAVEDTDEGIVLEELQKGYVFKDKVLRPAMVKVSG